MDLTKLLQDFDMLYEYIDSLVELTENGKKDSNKEFEKFFVFLDKILPDVFLLIDNTGLGTKELWIQMIRDLNYGIMNNDTCIISDCLFCGLGDLIFQYRSVIREALDEQYNI